jgi:cation transport ATPase
MSPCCDSGSSPSKAESQQEDALETPLEAETVSLFSVPKMDCPAEENMIRMALADVGQIKGFYFDLGKRQVHVFHDGDNSHLIETLSSLGLGATLLESKAATKESQPALNSAPSQKEEAQSLYWLLLINGVMFVAELGLGWYAQSTGLIADSLDMFADAAVYGIALYAVGRSARLQTRAAHLSGCLQLLLAMLVITDVTRRFLYGSEPYSTLMMSVGAVALLANISCLMLIYRHREGGAHMKASWIFSANDVIANLGIIIAGILVAYTGSRYPDLIIGAIISVVVLSGAYRILRLKTPQPK